MMSFVIRYIVIILIAITNTVYTQNQRKIKISRCSSCPDIRKLYDNSIIHESNIIESNKNTDDNIVATNKILYTPTTKDYKFILKHKNKKIQYLKERERCNLR